MTSAAPPNPPGEAISRARALEIARKTLSQLKPGTEFVVQEDKTVEKDFGWVFLYTTRAYLETGDRAALVPGTGPLVVERAGGGTRFLPTRMPPERAIQEYERRWREAHPAKQ